MAQKLIFDKQALIFIGGVCAIGFLIGATRLIYAAVRPCPDVTIAVSARALKENTPFIVTASAPNASVSSWDWDFGDGKVHQSGKVVTYVYKNAGKYDIRLTVNDRCKVFKELNVSADIGGGGAEGSNGPQPVIDGPTTAYVSKPTVYRETSGNAKKTWEWTSTETNKLDGTGQEVSYIFATPGTKTIYVTIDGQAKTSMDVTVVDAAGGGGGSKGKVDEVEFRQMLYKVINRKADYNIFKDCLCGKINMVMTAVDKNGGKPYAFDGYCKQIRSANYRTEIDDVKLTSDSRTRCITGIVIKQHSGSWAPLRK